MSQQALDLRRSAQIVRRHRRLVGIVAAFGLLVAGGYAAVHPPKFTSKALVVFPQSSSSMPTYIVVATSQPVLQGAQASLGPGVSLQTLREEVHAGSVTSSIISISASARTAAQAEATANAVAKSYAAYVSSPISIVPHIQTQVLEPATSAAGGDTVEQLVIFGILGALFGAIIGMIIALARNRSDPRLRERDDIANSVGIQVLASVPVAHPSNAAGWARLLDAYQPGAVHAWQLHTALQQLGVPGVSSGGLSDGNGLSLTVLSFVSDPGALALGPQIAVYAASLGISTALVIGPQQDSGAAATLRAACATPTSSSPNTRPHLQVMAPTNDGEGLLPSAALTVVVMVVDSKAPQLPQTARTAATVVGVSAGAVTAEQLARVASKAAANGHGIFGILVADPEPGDRTTGRVPSLAGPARRRRPVRVTGVKTEIRR
jgi:capsular polysaccharide biosynthesis protein